MKLFLHQGQPVRLELKNGWTASLAPEMGRPDGDRAIFFNVAWWPTGNDEAEMVSARGWLTAEEALLRLIFVTQLESI